MHNICLQQQKNTETPTNVQAGRTISFATLNGRKLPQKMTYQSIEQSQLVIWCSWDWQEPH